MEQMPDRSVRSTDRPLALNSEAPELFDASGAPRGSAQVPPDPAQACDQPRQQDASSAQRGEAAEKSGSSQKQQGSAGSRRLTPAQQAVAAALLVVLKRTMRSGTEALREAFCKNCQQQSGHPARHAVADERCNTPHNAAGGAESV